MEHAAEQVGAVEIEVLGRRLGRGVVAVVAEAGGEFPNVGGCVLVAQEQAGHDGQLVAGPGDRGGAFERGRFGLAGQPAKSCGFVERAAAGLEFLARGREDLIEGSGGTG
ncbi:hypothetical protein [Streptomyces sp. TLI_55]|uniref:hypothetical protein n=1 Tax=Streptomyces sp. TLI_55 TaxID=1938861 RepID=UPI00117D312B|nr:hypothetical protein [Streptomyces sp. TLI_55]